MPNLSCCDVFGNSGGDWVGCITDQYGKDGNISADSLFCSGNGPVNHYGLRSDSPCAPGNSPGECGLIGASPVVCAPLIPATVDFDLNTLNLKSHGRWVTCYIELPEGYNVADIDIASVMLNGSIHAEERLSSIGDYDGDGCSDLMVKFDRSAVGAILTCGQNVQITVTGNVGSRQFSGTDYIRVIKPSVIRPKDGGGTSAADAITLELHPNPFNPSVEIAYGVPVPARVVVQILSVDGRLVKTLEDAERSGGLYTIIWDGRDSAGRDASSGLYFCRLVVGSEIVTKKLTMLR